MGNQGGVWIFRIGYHVSVAQGIHLSLDRARVMGCNAMQIFVSNPRGWEIKPIIPEDKEKFLENAKPNDINPIVAHMPYLPNLASTNEATYAKSIDSLNKTVSLCSSLKIKYLVTHLGSHLGKGKDAGVENVTDAINRTEGLDSVTLLLENTAGSANSVGSTLDELAEILGKSEKKIGLCLDTCHLYAAGYDITKPEILDEIDEKLGFQNVHLFHLNDSKFPLGSRLDRHENIGKGHIGEEGFSKFFSYKKILEKPFIMETPEESKEELLLVKKLAGRHQRQTV